MANLTECPDCEMHFAGTKCSCGYTAARGKVIIGPWEEPAWMRAPQPCTADEFTRASKIVFAVTEHKLTVHEAHVALHAIFKGRELERGNTCACGIRL